MAATDSDTALPLDDVMLAMDVVDTLRHNQQLVDRELSEADREAGLVTRLREIYRQQGIEVSDQVLKEGVDALSKARFAYVPPEPGFGVTMARLYVSRGHWGKWLLGIAGAIILGFAIFQFVYLPYVAAQVETARVELAETLPQKLGALYQSIVDESKEQSATNHAADILAIGKSAAREGDRPEAEKAISELTDLRDLIRLQYSLRIVNRDGVRSGVWTSPDVNTDAANYYLIVEAIDPNGKTLELNIANEEDGTTERVPYWGIRVPEKVYRAVEADKLDNGIIENNLVGEKQLGYTKTTYAMPVLGGTLTRW